MSRGRALLHLVRADFLERVRRYAFLVTLVATLYLAYGVHTGNVAVSLDGYRGVYDSAWVGGMMALIVNTFLGLAGFYLVKNAVERDRRTGVGQILATTPISRPLYTLGKTLSNFAVLSVLVGVLAMAAVAFQLIHREDPRLDLFALLAPFVLVALPSMFFIAALAVFFETVPGLRGGLGNVVYFFLFGGLLIVSIAGRPLLDPIGLHAIGDAMREAAHAAFAGYRGGISISIEPVRENARGTFHWQGVSWTAPILFGRAWTALVGLGVALLAAVPFDRFDESRRARLKRASQPKPDRALDARPSVASHATLSAASLTPARRSFGLARTWIAELRLALAGTSRLWRLVFVGLLVAGAIVPPAGGRAWLLPIAWIWPVLVWSALGNREARHGVEALVFSAPHPLRRQLLASWLAGVTVAVLAGSTVALRLLIAGDGPGLVSWVVGALFIPSFALACGVWTGSGKLFEALYTLLWYVGPINRTPPLDFTGATPQSAAMGVPGVFALVALALLVLAFVGRKRRLETG